LWRGCGSKASSTLPIGKEMIRAGPSFGTDVVLRELRNQNGAEVHEPPWGTGLVPTLCWSVGNVSSMFQHTTAPFQKEARNLGESPGGIHLQYRCTGFINNQIIRSTRRKFSVKFRRAKKLPLAVGFRTKTSRYRRPLPRAKSMG